MKKHILFLFIASLSSNAHAHKIPHHCGKSLDSGNMTIANIDLSIGDIKSAEIHTTICLENGDVRTEQRKTKKVFLRNDKFDNIKMLRTLSIRSGQSYNILIPQTNYYLLRPDVMFGIHPVEYITEINASDGKIVINQQIYRSTVLTEWSTWILKR